jgi:iron complex outermembrane receptor protein
MTGLQFRIVVHCSVACLAAMLWPGVVLAQSALVSGSLGGTPFVLPEVTVVDTTPLHGDGIDRDKVPAMIQTLRAENFARTNSFTLTDTLGQRVPGVSITDVQGSTFFQDLRYRGFAASPLQGTPQGLAVYQNGIRLNEAFGDTVNWDLIPEAAIDRADIWTNNPAFGLNALGGAVSLQMKNGLHLAGLRGRGAGGCLRPLRGFAAVRRPEEYARLLSGCGCGP